MSAAVALRRIFRAEVLQQCCVLQGTMPGGMYGHGTSRIHPRAEKRYQELHTSIPLQSLPIALSRTSAKSFLCLNSEYEVKKMNYTVLMNWRRVLKESEETGSCCSPLFQSCLWKIGYQCYGWDTLRVPDGKCNFFQSPPLSPHSSVLFPNIKYQNKTDICFTSSLSFHLKF